MEAFPGVATAFGVHPWKAFEGVDEPRLESFLNGACAVGEIGLDWKVEVSRQLSWIALRSSLGWPEGSGCLCCCTAGPPCMSFWNCWVVAATGSGDPRESAGVRRRCAFPGRGCVMGFGGG
jgi:hypothetical protein